MQTRDLVIHHLEDRCIRYMLRGDCLQFSFDMHHCIAHCRLTIESGGLRILISGTKCTLDRIPDMLRYIAYTNRHIRSGCFVLDEDTRELAYTNCALFKEGELADGTIEGLIACAIYCYDRYLPGAMRVAYADADPIEEGQKWANAKFDEDEQSDDEAWKETMERLMGGDDAESLSESEEEEDDDEEEDEEDVLLDEVEDEDEDEEAEEDEDEDDEEVPHPFFDTGELGSGFFDLDDDGEAA